MNVKKEMCMIHTRMHNYDKSKCFSLLATKIDPRTYLAHVLGTPEGGRSFVRFLTDVQFIAARGSQRFLLLFNAVLRALRRRRYFCDCRPALAIPRFRRRRCRRFHSLILIFLSLWRWFRVRCLLGSPLVGSFILAGQGLKARELIGPGRDVGYGDGLRERKGEPESQK